MALFVVGVMLIAFMVVLEYLDKRDDEDLRKRDLELYARWLDRRSKGHHAN